MIPAKIVQNQKKIASRLRLSINIVSRFTTPTSKMGCIFKDQLFDLAGDDLMLGNVMDVASIPSEFMDFHKGRVSQGDTDFNFLFVREYAFLALVGEYPCN